MLSRIILAAAAVLISTPALAETWSVGESKDGTIKITANDDEVTLIKGSIHRGWFTSRYTGGAVQNGVVSARTLDEVDCNQKTIRTLQSTAMNAFGQPIGVSSGPEPITYADPQTINYRKLVFLCLAKGSHQFSSFFKREEMR